MENLVSSESLSGININSRLDNKVASFVYICLIFSFLACVLFVSEIAQSAGANLNDFWEGCVYSVIQFLLFLGLFFMLCRKLKINDNISSNINLYYRASFWNLGLSVLVALLSIASFMLLIYGTNDVLALFGYKINPDARLNLAQYFVAIIVLCAVPAIIEELFFRGLILKGLACMGKLKAVFASAFLFCIYHFNPQQTVYQFLLGVIFALVVLKTGNILYSIILHFLNNFFVLTAYTFVIDPAAKVAWNTVTVFCAIGFAVLGGLLIMAVCNAFKRQAKFQVASGKCRFVSFGNIGFFFAASFSLFLWMIVFLGNI